jgi:hypothetical protein
VRAVEKASRLIGGGSEWRRAEAAPVRYFGRSAPALGSPALLDGGGSARKVCPTDLALRHGLVRWAVIS